MGTRRSRFLLIKDVCGEENITTVSEDDLLEIIKETLEKEDWYSEHPNLDVPVKLLLPTMYRLENITVAELPAKKGKEVEFFPLSDALTARVTLFDEEETEEENSDD